MQQYRRLQCGSSSQPNIRNITKKIALSTIAIMKTQNYWRISRLSIFISVLSLLMAGSRQRHTIIVQTIPWKLYADTTNIYRVSAQKSRDLKIYGTITMTSMYITVAQIARIKFNLRRFTYTLGYILPYRTFRVYDRSIIVATTTQLSAQLLTVEPT